MRHCASGQTTSTCSMSSPPRYGGKGGLRKPRRFTVKHVQSSPTSFRTLNNLGMTLYAQERMNEAADCYRQALRLKPDCFEAKTNLASVLCTQGLFDEATKWLMASQALRPESAELLQNIGMNLARQGRWHEAVEYYEQALRRNPDCAELHCTLAYALLCCGEYQRGWTEFEWRLRCDPHPGYKINRTFWSGDDLPDRTILLHAELGYGDILQFIRYAPMVKRRVGRVVVLSPPKLLQLLARCNGVDLAFTAGTYTPVCHVHAPLMSLPGIFGTTLDTVPAPVPYLVTDPVLVDHWRSVVLKTIADDHDAGHDALVNSEPDRPARPFLIGIAWQGNPENPVDRWRSIPLASFAPLAELPGVRLISLQANHGLDQIEAAKRVFRLIELPGRRGRDFMETAAIMTHLDLIIAPDSAVVHLAGGLGLPGWLGLSTIDDWRWLAGREKNAWYPTLRLFRQTTLGRWDEVIQQMTLALKAELHGIGNAA